mmetsp:Transcript_20525/g.48291  ORF Transcript_20525/g.48291 Transcript_20525/m.48291 type:complete len:519 (+) Transcript_20525:1311-2867(+)
MVVVVLVDVVAVLVFVAIAVIVVVIVIVVIVVDVDRQEPLDVLTVSLDQLPRLAVAGGVPLRDGLGRSGKSGVRCGGVRSVSQDLAQLAFGPLAALGSSLPELGGVHHVLEDGETRIGVSPPDDPLLEHPPARLEDGDAVLDLEARLHVRPPAVLGSDDDVPRQVRAAGRRDLRIRVLNPAVSKEEGIENLRGIVLSSHSQVLLNMACHQHIQRIRPQSTRERFVESLMVEQDLQEHHQRGKALEARELGPGVAARVGSVVTPEGDVALESEVCDHVDDRNAGLLAHVQIGGDGSEGPRQLVERVDHEGLRVTVRPRPGSRRRRLGRIDHEGHLHPGFVHLRFDAAGRGRGEAHQALASRPSFRNEIEIDLLFICRIVAVIVALSSPIYDNNGIAFGSGVIVQQGNGIARCPGFVPRRRRCFVSAATSRPESFELIGRITLGTSTYRVVVVDAVVVLVVLDGKGLFPVVITTTVIRGTGVTAVEAVQARGIIPDAIQNEQGWLPGVVFGGQRRRRRRR